MLGKIAISGILVVGLGSMALARSWVRTQAETEGLAKNSAVEEMDPADFMGTTAIGGLRPILVDLLWARAADAFSRKDWYDALAISELICRLQPNLPQVWEFNSWNMSYNIAVSRKQLEKPEEEWQWVLRGIDYAKKGIKKNPNAAELYRWISELYLAKGQDENYADRFEKMGVDASTESVSWAREAMKRDTAEHHIFPLFLSITLRKKIEAIEDDGLAEQKKAEIQSLAQEAVSNLKLTNQRFEKLHLDPKDLTEFRGSNEKKIQELESKYLNSIKVKTPSESKESNGN